MNWLVEIFVGGQHVRRLILDIPEVFIGRSPSSNIHLPHGSCSRRHLRLAVASEHIIMEDLNSTNGVYLNAHKVGRGIIKGGDRITVGPYTFLVEQIESKMDIPTVSEAAIQDEQTGRSTVFIDEEIRRKILEKSSPLEETQIDEEE